MDDDLRIVILALLRRSAPHVGLEIKAALGNQIPDDVNQAIKDAVKNYWAEPTQLND